MFNILQYFGIIHLLLWPHLSHSTTHWIVTENGMINSIVNSPMHMKRPWDLVEWMRQEERSILLNKIDKKLAEFKQEESVLPIDNSMEELYRNNHWCISAAKKLKEFDLYTPAIVTLKDRHLDEPTLFKPDSEQYWTELHTELLKPDCDKVIPLDFSINAFEHLDSMKNRHKLESTSEVYIYKKVVPPEYTLNQLGHILHLSLQNNTTSWKLYTLAAFYWRIKGNAAASVECSRRALHFCPRSISDIPLVNLAGLLFSSKETKDAIVLMKAALSILSTSEYREMLGNMYAINGQYDESVIEYESILHDPLSAEIKPQIEQKIKALLCHRDVERAIDDKQRKMSETLAAYKSYASNYELIRLKVMAEEADIATQIQSEYFFELYVTRERESLYCRISESGEKMCPKNLPIQMRPTSSDYQMRLKTMAKKVPQSLNQEKVKLEEKHSQLNKMQSRQLLDYSNPIRPQRYHKLNEPLANSHPLMNTTLPSSRECESYNSMPAPSDYPSIYLPAENKGFEVLTLLAENLGILPNEEHELPWYPPQCITMLDLPEESPKYYDHLNTMKDRFKLVQASHLYSELEDAASERWLKQLARRGQASSDDVGQRIFTAMKQKSGPDWLLFNLAGLYWRSKGQLFYGMECQRRALHTVPDAYRDVPLMNLAAMFYQWKRYDDASVVAKEALSVNDLEPTVHLFYGALLANNGNFSGALVHWRKAVRQDPSLAYPCTQSRDHWCLPDLIMRTRCELARTSRLQRLRMKRSQQQASDDFNDGTNKSTVTRNKRGLDSSTIDTICDIFIKYDIINSDADCPFPYQVLDYGTALPHIKIVKNQANILIYGLVWFPHSKLFPEESECFVFNDTSRTNGCTLEESLFYASEKIFNFFSECISVLENPESVIFIKRKTLDDEISFKSLEKLITVSHMLDRPSFKQCLSVPKLNFTQFTSTLLTLEAKGVDVRSLLHKVNVNIDDADTPNCEPPLGDKHWLFKQFTKHNVWKVANVYTYESSLEDSFLNLAGGLYDMKELAFIISAGHRANRSDWIMANLAGLYWRIKGDIWKSHRCLIIAYDNSPSDSIDVALIGLANIAFQLNKLQLAQHLTRLALEASPRTVISHFTMANLFAAEENYHWASKFYEATLGLQDTFQPAIQRLRALQCQEVLQQSQSQIHP